MSGTQGHSSKCICNMAIWLLVNVGHAGHRFGVPFLFEGGLTCMLATQGQIYGGRAGQMPESPIKKATSILWWPRRATVRIDLYV